MNNFYRGFNNFWVGLWFGILLPIILLLLLFLMLSKELTSVFTLDENSPLGQQTISTLSSANHLLLLLNEKLAEAETVKEPSSKLQQLASIKQTLNDIEKAEQQINQLAQEQKQAYINKLSLRLAQELSLVTSASMAEQISQALTDSLAKKVGLTPSSMTPQCLPSAATMSGSESIEIENTGNDNGGLQWPSEENMEQQASDTSPGGLALPAANEK